MKITGNAVLVYVNDVAIGCLTGCSLTLENEEIITTCKDFDGHKTIMPGGSNWSIDFDGNFETESAIGFTDLVDLLLNKTLFTVKFGLDTEGGLFLSGDGYLNSLKWDGPLNAVSKFTGKIGPATPLEKGQVGPGPPVSDPDAESYFLLEGNEGLSQEEKDIITIANTRIKDEVGWSKCKGLYYLIGGSESSHKWNMVDQRDLDAAYRLSFTDMTHDENGITGNMSSAFAETHLNLLTVFGTNKLSYHAYVRTYTDGAVMGASIASAEYPTIGVMNNGYNIGGGFRQPSPLIQEYLGMRSSLYINPTEICRVFNGKERYCYTAGGSWVANPNSTFQIGKYQGGSHSDANICFVAITENLTLQEAQALNDIVTEMQESLGRAITPDYAAMEIDWYGNSVVAGAFAENPTGTRATDGWCMRVAIAKGYMVPVDLGHGNFGIGSSSLTEASPAAPGGSLHANRLDMSPKYGWRQWCVISHAQLDAIYRASNPGTYTSAKFRSDAQDIIDNLVSIGWDQKNIIFDFGVNVRTDFPIAEYLDCGADIDAVVAANSNYCWKIDNWAACHAYGNSDMDDDVHPNNSGHLHKSQQFILSAPANF